MRTSTSPGVARPAAAGSPVGSTAAVSSTSLAAAGVPQVQSPKGSQRSNSRFQVDLISSTKDFLLSALKELCQPRLFTLVTRIESPLGRRKPGFGIAASSRNLLGVMPFLSTQGNLFKSRRKIVLLSATQPRPDAVIWALTNLLVRSLAQITLMSPSVNLV